MNMLYSFSAWFGGVLLSVNNDLTNGVIDAASSAPAATQAADAAEAVAEAAPLTFWESVMQMAPTILIYGAVIFALYWFMFRPQRKKEKEIQQMRKELKTGDNIVTSSGFYGKIVDMQEDCFVIEFGTNKGIRVPVRKSEIVGLQTTGQPASPGETK